MKKALKDLLHWSKSTHQQLPWRLNRTLYTTLVSEIMLQQTTVGTVLQHYPRFLALFPDLKTLALATDDEIQIAWKGLGYYRRARNLKNAAVIILEKHQGIIPENLEDLLAIKGIGPYTAGALLSIGLDQKALAIDANLERVISRLFTIENPKGPLLHKEIQKRFEQGELFPKVASYRDLNEALMDLGRVYCQARKAHCLACPMRESCLAAKESEPTRYPVSVEKKQDKHELELLRVVVKKSGKVLGYRKSEKEWLSNQIEMPTFIIETTDKTLKQYPLLQQKIPYSLKELPVFKTGITKYTIVNRILEIDYKDYQKYFAVDEREFKFFDLNENLATSAAKTLQRCQ